MVSVPVVLVASFAHRLFVGSGGAVTDPFCIQPEVAVGCTLYTGVRTGAWYGPETWPNAGLLNKFC